MTWFDLVVIALLAASALLAFLRGFVREILGVIAWVGAAFVGVSTGSMFEPFFSGFSAEPPIIDALSLGTAFILALVIFSIIAMIIGRIVRGSVLGGVDRTLGAVYGLVRGVVVVVAAYIGIGMGIHVDRWPEPVLQSRSMGLAYAGAAFVVGWLPDEWRPVIQPPPTGRDPNAAGMMHASPADTSPSSRPRTLATGL